MKNQIVSVAILILSYSTGFSKTLNCDSIFYQSFYNFVNYDDSVGYSLTYRIDTKFQSCLTDTIGLISFLLSDRYALENSRAILDEDLVGLSTTPKSILANHTDYVKKKRLPDSIYRRKYPTSLGQGPGLICLPIDVLMLYFISSLYYNDFQFRDDIMLSRGWKIVGVYTDQEYDKKYPIGTSFEIKVKNEEIIESALKSYRRWEKRVEKNGLARMRKKGKNPLTYRKRIKWSDDRFLPF